MCLASGEAPLPDNWQEAQRLLRRVVEVAERAVEARSALEQHAYLIILKAAVREARAFMQATFTQ